MNQPEVGSGHLLLGLLLEAEGVAARALKKLGVQPEQMRSALAGELSAPGGRVRTGIPGRPDPGLSV